MKIHLIGGALVLVAMMAAAGLLVFARQTPQLQTTDLPTPSTSPSPVPTPLPTLARSDIEIRVSPVPTQLGQTPAPSASATVFNYAINLNTDIEMYSLLGLPEAQEQAILDLRCAPAVPPETPYPEHLDGCDANAAGIAYLDDIVEAGIMSVEEVDRALAGKVFQTWRDR